MQKLKNIIKKSIALYRKEFFDRLIFSDTPLHEVKPLFVLCEFPFCEQGSFLVAALSINRLQSEGNQIDDYSIATGIEYLVSEMIQAEYQGYVFTKNTRLVLAIIRLADIEEMNAGLFDEIRCQILDNFPVDCTIGVGDPVDNVFEIRESYQYANLALTKQFYDSKNKVFYSRDITTCNPNLTVEKDIIQTLCDSILQHDQATLSFTIKDIIDKMKQSNTMEIEYGYSICYLVVSRVLYSISTELNLPFWDFLAYYKDKIYQCNYIEEIESLLLSLSEHIEQIHTETSLDQNDKYVSRIKLIIARDYMQDITIQSISSELFLTPAYICSIFKKLTNKTINKYLTEIRIAKAKELLVSNKYHVYQVAAMVGYKDVKYFRKIFQQHTGFTPSQYIEKFLLNRE
jgi:two-component system response regulator YesN